MRVLSLFAVALTGCYDPAVGDCQFTCPDNRCPGDLTCTAGVCRTPGASGSCPCSDPPAGCILVSNSAGACLAACTSTHGWDDAQNACAATPPWHLAVLDAPGALSAGENALLPPTKWIGLHRDLTGGWAWISGGGSVSPAASDWTMDPLHAGTVTLNMCAAINSGKLYSDTCDALYAYACTIN